MLCLLYTWLFSNSNMNSIIIQYSSIITDCTPKVSVGTRFDGFTYTELLRHGSGTIECQVDLRLFDNLLIKFFDKIWSPNGDTRLDINSIAIDNIALDHLIFAGKQYPDYNVIEFNKHVDQVCWQPGTTFHLNGVYELELSTPIWYFRVKNA